MGRHLLNVRTDSDKILRINIPLGRLDLKANEVALKTTDNFLAEKLNTYYNSRTCGEENRVTIPISKEMKYFV